ncbi:MAG: hypothetical protein VKI81_08360 [Synechococcaceae cyanobacterium]|nr:hypothetical protein [Synechococcaceae cyanobacterium]
MAESRHRSSPGSAPAPAPASALVVSALAGAVLGAAGLGWWLLSEAERRRQAQRQLRLLRLSRLQAGAREPESATGAGAPLHDRVQQLNRAIDEVRRQLEQLQPLP